MAGENIFAFCLSEEADLLSQWRGYADDGRGVCIGFKKEALELYLKTKVENNSITLNKVLYSDDDLERGMQQSLPKQGLAFRSKSLSRNIKFAFIFSTSHKAVHR